MRCLCFFVCTGILLSAAAASARTWYVLPDSTGDVPTITAGLDSASYGDTVLVAPGTYMIDEYDPGTWVYLRPGVSLVSEGGRDLTTIEFCHSRDSIVFQNCEGAHMSGFTIRSVSGPECEPPMAPGFAVFCYNCTDITIEDCIIEGEAYGLYVVGGSSEWWKPAFKNLVIRDCVYGIACYDVSGAGRPHFKGIQMTDCTMGADILDSSPLFESCEITYCSLEGMRYKGHCGGDLWKCQIAYNAGGGVTIRSDPPLAAPSFNGQWLPRDANDFHDNGSWDIWYEHSSPQSLVMATYNYWGSDCPDFTSKIHGTVRYSPWVDSTHTLIFTESDCPDVTEPTTWGAIKTLFR